MSFTSSIGSVTIGSSSGGGGGGGTIGLAFPPAIIAPLNSLTVVIYERNSTTVVADSSQDLLRAQGLTFTQIFPGGLFGACSFFVPRDPTFSWPFRTGQRLVVRNGITVVYEGEITNIGYKFGNNGEAQGRWVEAAGQWENLLGHRGWNKPWADNRMGDDAWPIRSLALGKMGTFRRDNSAIRLVPKDEAFALNQNFQLLYTAPTGETVKRVKLSYDMQEAAQAWKLALYNITAAADIWSVTASGTGTRDDTLGTPSQSLALYFEAAAAQTPNSKEDYYGQVDNAVSGANAFMVYTETGSINAQEIAKDIRAKISADLNSDETNIGALTLALEPFITNGWERMNSILQRAVSYGDASFNSWYARLLESDRAATPDGKPVLQVAQYAALTDYDYEIRANAENVSGFQIKKDASGIYNWIVVTYTNENGRPTVLTPDDDANLKDTTSITEYGQREYYLNVGNATATTAKNWARRLLAASKDAKFFVSGPITVTGYIKGKNGNIVPAANIRAGERVKIVNFLTDEVGVSGAGLTFHITQMSYDDDGQTAQLSTGVPDNLAVFLAQLAAGFVV